LRRRILGLSILLLVSGVCPAQTTRREVVVVTGTAEPIPLEEIDRSVDVLPVANQPTLATALVDFLRLDPSLDVMARAPGGVQTDVSIRGGSFGQTLVLLNGQRLSDAQTGHHDMDIPVPLEAVDRIEVLRGSGSTLYGSDAVAGVLNIITRQPEATEARVSVAAGNFGVNEERVTLGTVFKKLAEELSFSRDFSSGFMPDRDYRNLSAASDTWWRSRLGASSLMMAYSDKPFGADQFYGNFNSWEDTKTWFASLVQDLGDRTQAAFSVRRHSDWFVLLRDQPSVYQNHHADETFDLAIRRSEPLAANTGLHYGIEGYGDTIESTNLGDHNRSRAAAYVSLDARALGRFSFSAGVREEMYRWSKGELSPTLAAGAWLAPRWKLHASASRAFRIPTYTDLYYEDPANFGNPNLKPETAWSFDAGIDWRRSDTFRCSVTVFERRESNDIDYVRASTADPWQATNIARLRFIGVEASATIVPARGQQITVSYEALDGAEQALGGLLSKYVFNYPTQSGVVALHGSYRGVTAQARLGVVNRLGRPPYALFDVSAGYGRRRIHPFVRLTNLGDARYQEIAGVPMPGRAAMGGLEWALR
jgi:iron complex outermembrane receptor protein